MRHKCPYNLCKSKCRPGERFCLRHLRYRAKAQALKERLKPTKCEWVNCDENMYCVTSTELTESGFIKLCAEHFNRLPT